MRSRFLHLIKSGGFALTEGAIIERLRRIDASMLDQNLLNAPLIYSDVGKVILEGLHRQYIEIGRCYNLPLLTFSDTWRAGSVRVQKAGMSGRDINGDCVRFLRSILHCYGDYADKVYLGGLIGCKGDAYRPEEALSEREASSYHSFQIDALAEAGVDFLFAATIPSLSEAAGIASAMARTGVPYAISFVLNRSGLILDGAPLFEAISTIDKTVPSPPLFYMANCCHPTFYQTAMSDLVGRDTALLRRIIGLQANTSAMDAFWLDNLAYLDSEDPAAFAASMMALHLDFGTRILGGCCGTDDCHITALAEACGKSCGKNNVT